MSDDRLRGLGILSVNRERSGSINLNHVIDRLAANPRRIELTRNSIVQVEHIWK